MSFQFVNTTASKRKPDEKTRRKIRSQVMKDYRRRREASHGPSQASSSVEASSSGRNPLSRTQSGQDSRQASPSELLGEKSAKRGRPGKDQREQTASLFVQTTHGLFANFTLAAPASNPPQLTTPDEADVEHIRMSEICETFNEWLGSVQPGLTVLTRPTTRSGPEGDMQLYARTMNAIGHLHAIGVFQGEDERAYYKARLLNIANQVLQDSSMALDETTLAALACLTSYEISFGSHEALTHLIGISRIIAAKGGFEGLDNDFGLPMMLKSLDLSHALYFNTERVLTPRTTDKLSPSSSPTEVETRSTADSADESSIEEDVRRWQDTLRDASSYLRDNGSPEPSQACFLAWRLHLFQPQSTVAWSPQSVGEMDDLFQVMTMMPTDAWGHNSALQARVIITAFATARESAQKSWYYTQLSRLISQTEPQYWDDFMNLMAGFVASQAFFRHPVMQTVRALVGGVEIVVERSLAEQMSLDIV